MVETSGRKLEINDAYVSTIADHGETGQWLLDPGDIDISSSGTVSSLTTVISRLRTQRSRQVPSSLH